MNCNDFEGCLRDLAGQSEQEESVHAEALRHASACSRCSARLADERALAAGLRVLARRAQLEAAPAGLEESLLKRFREVKPAMAGMRTATDVLSPKPRGWNTPGYVGIAASLLLVLGWALSQLTRHPDIDKAQVLQEPAPAAVSREKPAAPVKVKPKPSSEPARKPVGPPSTRPRRVSTPVAEGQVQYAGQFSRGSEHRPGESERSPNDSFETEFLPFMAAGPQYASEQRQFVRVKLPRSALHVFGLPMNMERAREPVQADVLLSEDGRALAVRFVRD